MKLTKLQRQHLVRLYMLGSTRKDWAAGPGDAGMYRFSPMAAGKLCDMGFVGKRVQTRKGSQRTIYWLTEDGCKVANDLWEAAFT